MKIDIERLIHSWLGNKAMIKFTTKGIDVYNGRLIIPIPNGISIEQLNNARKDGKALNVEIKLNKEKKARSLSSNAYCWVLCQEIAEEMSKNGPLVRKEEVYRNSIRELFAPRVMVVPNEDKDEVISDWQSRGIGWMCEDLGESTLYGHTRLGFYVGSSRFDTKTMSRLIEGLIQDALALGLNVKSEEEIMSMLSSWEIDRKKD